MPTLWLLFIRISVHSRFIWQITRLQRFSVFDRSLMFASNVKLQKHWTKYVTCAMFVPFYFKPSYKNSDCCFFPLVDDWLDHNTFTHPLRKSKTEMYRAVQQRKLVAFARRRQTFRSDLYRNRIVYCFIPYRTAPLRIASTNVYSHCAFDRPNIIGKWEILWLSTSHHY